MKQMEANIRDTLGDEGCVERVGARRHQPFADNGILDPFAARIGALNSKGWQT